MKKSLLDHWDLQKSWKYSKQLKLQQRPLTLCVHNTFHWHHPCSQLIGQFYQTIDWIHYTYYANTGCGVFKIGIKITKSFGLKSTAVIWNHWWILRIGVMCASNCWKIGKKYPATFLTYVIDKNAYKSYHAKALVTNLTVRRGGLIHLENPSVFPDLRMCSWSTCKGQTKSKLFFQADVSSKKQTNERMYSKPQVDLFSFLFWKELKTI